MIKSIEKTQEILTLTDSLNSDNHEFSIELIIDYRSRTWTILTCRNYEAFVFKQTRNYEAGKAIGRLITEATEIARTRLSLTNDELDGEFLPF